MLAKVLRYNNSMSEQIKPFYGNKIIALVLILAELVFYGLVLFSSFTKDILFSCLTLKIPKDEKILQRIFIFFDQIPLISFIIFVSINIGFLVSITALFILMINDDCNIRFAKLKELKDVRSEVKTFENKLNKEIMVKETIERPIGNHTATKTTEKTRTNYLYEFYKKYMDTLVDI